MHISLPITFVISVCGDKWRGNGEFSLNEADTISPYVVVVDDRKLRISRTMYIGRTNGDKSYVWTSGNIL